MFSDELSFKIIATVFVAILTGIVGLLSWLFRTEKTKIDNHEKEIERLKAQAVTEDKVREIVTESINTAVYPIRDDISEIKELVKRNTLMTEQLQIKVAQQEGYQQAVKEFKTIVGGN
jgi:hypothetical protein